MASPETFVPSTTAIREELDLILASAGFSKAKQLRTFLSFLVEKTLAHELDELKEYSIAVQVFGREESFDPTTDNIVRVEARRLRTRLAEYYASEGRFDPLLIAIPKGSYIPHFSTRTFQDEDRLADALSQYQIAERLGAMSDGVLYRGTDLRLGRKVLLWVTSRVQDPARLKPMLERARAAAALHHPNLCPIYEVGELPDKRVFMVMASPGDSTLSECLRRGELSVTAALEAAEHVAEALAVGHSSGLVYGALTPESVFVDASGKSPRWPQALLVFLATDYSSTSDNLRRSPEQRRGAAPDIRSDIWAVGALLYESVTGRVLKEGDDFEAGLASIPKQTSPGLTRIIRRCLEADPERRYQTATELANELKAVLLPAPPTPVVAKREKAKWVWGGVALLATLLGLDAALLWFHSEKTQERPLKVIPVTHYAGREASPSFSPDGSQVAFSWEGPKSGNVDIYVKLVGQGQPLRLTQDPQPDLCPSWSPDGKWIAFLRQVSDFEYSVMLIPALGGRERRLAQVRYLFLLANRKPAWSPDSRFLVLSSASPAEDFQSLIRVSIENGEVTRVLKDRSGSGLNLIMPTISPSGRRLAFTRTRIASISRIQLLPISSLIQPAGETKELGSLEVSAIMPEWIDDQDLVFATGGPRSTLWRVRANGADARQIMLPGGSLTEPAVNRTSHRLAYVSQTQEANVWGLDLAAAGESVGAPSLVLQSTQRQANAQFSPDGRQIAFSSNREGGNEIWIARSDGSEAFQLTSLGAPSSGSARWSPDGRQLAFDSNLGGHDNIYVVNVNDGVPHRLTNSRGTDNVPSWSPDGHTIYFGSDRDGTVQVWKMNADGSNPQRVTKNGGYAPLSSPDGSSIFYIRGQGSAASLWRVPSSGGEETQVADSVYRFNFAVVADGLYYMTAPRPLAKSVLRFIDLASHATKDVATLDKPPELGLSVSQDGRHLLFAQIDRTVSDIMLAENFQ
jgi:Tol biopolymer transport system component